MSDHPDPGPEKAPEPTPSAHEGRWRPQRSWWAALIGAGLAAVALIGVIVLRADDTAVAPVQTTPETTPQPTVPGTPEPTTAPAPTTEVPGTTDLGPTGASVVVDGGCITVSTAAGSATGCPEIDGELDQLEQRVFVADLDRPVLITSGSADPLVDLTATADTADFASRCRWEVLAPRVPDGGLVELVVCNDTGVMALTVAADTRSDDAPAYFTLPSPILQDGAVLGAGEPIDGMRGALAFTVTVDDVSTCSILLLADRSGWKETCSFPQDDANTAVLAQVDSADGGVHELTTDTAGLFTSARLLDAMAPSSGCSIDSADQLLQALAPSSIVTGIGCIEDRASLTTGPVLTQEGPPDGSIWLASRDDAGRWSITDNGTGIEDFSFPVVAGSVWEAWPESTVPGFRPFWQEPIAAIPVQPTVDAFADELLTTLATLNTDPEFPLNERLVEIRPAELPLIIAQVDIGGDDSIAGQVIYVWLDEEFDENDPIGWQAGEVLVGEVCARGETAGQDLCV